MKTRNEYEAPILEIISVSAETNFAQSTPPYNGETEIYDIFDPMEWEK